ncbi:DinB family protein [Flavobacterium jejuense]|uniref:DinB family protein n=1 Tax=Flavobacterium jejuense TaxID=1544455 RepID=A0ABX0IUD6_9FLAO|nr:DinB family protein [Flavobacterium jejuense]NHN25419.1 DinB family protein [Flavobacterium jejuense]
METIFSITTNVRNQFLNFIEKYTLEQLNTIPKGFSNNIIWNIAHCVATQQTLIYKLSGLPMHVSDEFINTYRNGTIPTGKTSQEEVDYIKSILFSSVQKIGEDFSKDIFVNFHEYTTKSTGFTMQNALQAAEFNNFHEGIHLGIILQIRKFV